MRSTFDATTGILIQTYDTPPKVVAAEHAYFRECPRFTPLGTDWETVRIDPQFQTAIAMHYDSLPLVDEDLDGKVRASYDQLAYEIDAQFYCLERWGIRFEVSEEDPYEDLLEAAEDVRKHNRLAVLSTKTTGGHPFWSDLTNDRFRYVHDAFGHMSTGRNFDRHGEEAAYQHHRTMLTPGALPALASETRGQNSSLILNGEFGPQRAALMDPWAWLA